MRTYRQREAYIPEMKKKRVSVDDLISSPHSESSPARLNREIPSEEVDEFLFMRV